MPPPETFATTAAGLRLDTLTAWLERRGARLDRPAVGYLGHAVGSVLADGHARSDEEGNPAPVLHLSLGPNAVHLGWDGAVRVLPPAEAPGSPAFFAPEQRRGERLTPRTDAHGLGLLVWSLLAGKPPPGEGEPGALASRLEIELPAGFAAALDLALEPLAARRRITCEELSSWLESLGDLGHGRAALRAALAAYRAEPPLPTATPSLGPAPTIAAPPVPTVEPGSRPLSLLQAAGVALATASLVIAVGLIVAEAGDRGGHPRAPAAWPPASEAAGATPREATPAASPIAVVAADSGASPPESEAAATGATSATPASTDFDALPADLGWLTVAAGGEAMVYVNGEPAGRADQPLRVRCGTRVVRLGVPAADGGAPAWLGPARSVAIACRKVTHLEPAAP